MAELPRICRTCEHWQAYAPGLGECLEYVKRRQEAFARHDGILAFHRAWPHRPAVDTEESFTCDRYEFAAEGAA